MFLFSISVPDLSPDGGAEAERGASGHCDGWLWPRQHVLPLLDLTPSRPAAVCAGQGSALSRLL